jgi:hypothetical protein
VLCFYDVALPAVRYWITHPKSDLSLKLQALFLLLVLPTQDIKLTKILLQNGTLCKDQMAQLLPTRAISFLTFSPTKKENRVLW